MCLDLFSNIPNDKGRFSTNKIFEKAYNELNMQQKNAVDHIEGPVMVIAGPGTGKTQVLAVRIGKILIDTDVDPHNILCLTFTDAATLAMRNRLVEIIGSTAHKVHIFTFHGFCNQVIQENLGIFGNYKQLEKLEDVEQIDVLKQILESLPNDHILKSLKGNDDYTRKQLENLFERMKKENYTPKEIEESVQEYLERRLSDEKDEIYYQVKRGENKKGDLRKHVWDELAESMEKLVSGAKLFENYQAILHRHGRYDYADMILWVLREFQNNNDLLASYQERYQYILVDEYQDTNGAQNDVLNALISFWDERPNVFVVGDDDQAIYKFQGANIGNIEDFCKNYKPYIVVLTQNYRSGQPILDSARNVIEKNTERIVKNEQFKRLIAAQGSHLDKILKASGDKNKHYDAQPEVYVFQNESQEDAWLAQLINEYYQNGEDLSKTAILYRQHSQVDRLVDVLDKKGIRINIKKKANILAEPLIENLLTILKYLSGEYEKPLSSDSFLAEMMYYIFFRIEPIDIAKISIYQRKNPDESPKLTWREMITDESILSSINLKNKESIIKFSGFLDGCIQAMPGVTMQVLFEKILNEGNILNHILHHPERNWQLQLVNTFFDFIKDETGKRPDLSLKDLLALLDKMVEYGVDLPARKITQADNGVQFITAHSAKGLEFERVIIVGANKDKWVKKSSNRYKFAFPDNMNEDTDSNVEDERRLFFVAMTRAKRQLIITYSEKNDDDGTLGASQFVDELYEGGDIQKVHKNVDDDTVIDLITHTMSTAQINPSLLDHDLIARVLENYRLSVTGLNKYMTCPVKFYFEEILRIPSARNKYMGFGRAVHYALQYFYLSKSKGENPMMDTLTRYFHQGMENHRSHFTPTEFKNFTAYGEDILQKYYSEYLSVEASQDKYELELKIEHAQYNGIPIKGVIDKVEIRNGEAMAYDYKTGNFTETKTRAKLKKPEDKNPDGGDYWRQIVFYKILSDSDTRLPWNMTTGIISFVEPDKTTGKFESRKYAVSLEDIKHVGDQIEEVWASIQNHEFNNGCNDKKCNWCNFVKNEFVNTGSFELDSEDEI